MGSMLLEDPTECAKQAHTGTHTENAYVILTVIKGSTRGWKQGREVGGDGSALCHAISPQNITVWGALMHSFLQV